MDVHAAKALMKLTVNQLRELVVRDQRASGDSSVREELVEQLTGVSMAKVYAEEAQQKHDAKLLAEHAAAVREVELLRNQKRYRLEDG